MGFILPAIAWVGANIGSIAAVTGAVGAVGSAAGAIYAGKRARDIQRGISGAATLKSLAPPPPIAGPTASEIETRKAKESADKRAAEREKVIATQTAADIATRRRSLTGLSATIRTSPFGLIGPATTEKKTLLGQGGLR